MKTRARVLAKALFLLVPLLTLATPAIAGHGGRGVCGYRDSFLRCYVAPLHYREYAPLVFPPASPEHAALSWYLTAPVCGPFSDVVQGVPTSPPTTSDSPASPKAP